MVVLFAGDDDGARLSLGAGGEAGRAVVVVVVSGVERSRGRRGVDKGFVRSACCGLDSVDSVENSVENSVQRVTEAERARDNARSDWHEKGRDGK